MIFEIIIVIIGIASLIYIIKNFEIFAGIVGITVLLIIVVGLLILFFIVGRFLFSIPEFYNFIDKLLTFSIATVTGLIGVSFIVLGIVAIIYFFKDTIEAIINLIKRLIKKN